ncbi:hypothetical protein [uncultured Sulfitobacter sp.]|uniref:hypothetical protein n=1 Tax=uncultured Sulfitobacter sp. TaxID=191468 RepID=UPI0026260516|nr:hypothetical protein [uncultured Sulfitobacter sp.]
MARDWEGHARNKEVPLAPHVHPSSGTQSASMPGSASILLSLVKSNKRKKSENNQTQQLARIRSSLRTVAILLEANHAYLPLFLRLEQELIAEQSKHDAIARSKKYLPHQR